VGICASGDERNLGPLLDNLLWKQGLSRGSEILVVCSGCSERTLSAVRERLGDARVRLFLEGKRSGKAAAINKILSKAREEHIIFISADVMPRAECFSKLMASMDDGVGIVSGKPVPLNASSCTSGRLVHLLWRFHHRMFTYLNHAGLLMHASEVYCIRRGIVSAVPQNAVNDDAYMAVTSKAQGWGVRYEPAAQVMIHGPGDVVDYFRQRRRIVYGHYQVRKLTGRFPQYLAYWALMRPTKILRLVLDEMRAERSLPTIAAAFLLELLINFTAIVDFLLGKSHIPWRIIHSTKEPLGEWR